MYTALIVDDEKIVRSGLIQTIQWDNLGIDQILEASNGEEAFHIFRENSIDIILTDIKMPKMNGIELIHKIKERDNKTHIIVISGYSDFEYLQSAIRHGVNDYILKPIRGAEINDVLLAVIDKLNVDNIYVDETAVLRENTLYRMVQGMISRLEVKEKFEQLGCDLRYGKYSVSIVNPVSEVSNSVLYTITYMYNKILNRMNMGNAFVHPNKDIVIIYDSIASEADIRENQKLIDEIIAKKVKLQTKCYHGVLVDEIDEISYSYQEVIKRKEESKNITCSKVIEETLNYIDEHYTENITLTSMAEIVYANASYLGYLFKKELGVSCVEYVNQKRIDRAARYLLETNMKVYEIMDNVGITDKNYFLRLFKKYKGKTPTEYRKN